MRSSGNRVSPCFCTDDAPGKKMMPPLYCPPAYPPEVCQKLEQMSPLAQQIACRWMRSWPQRVKALLAAGEYLSALTAQEEAERMALARCTPPPSEHAVLMQEYGLSLAPPYPVGTD